MAPIQPPQPGGDFGQYGEDFDGEGGRRRRALVRYSVPVAIAGVAAATLGLGTALAATGGSPSLPRLTAEQLLVRMAQSRTHTVSGTVQITTDLGIPAGVLGGTALPGGAASPFGGAAGRSGSAGGGSSADPQSKLTELLSGTHTLRVAADGPERQRIAVLDSAAEYSIIHNGNQLWAYDSATNSVFHESGSAGAHRKSGAKPAAGADHAFPATPQAAVQQAMKAVDPTTSVTVDGTAEVAGRSAYELLIAPRQAGSTIGAIRVAVDAGNGVPLAFTLTPKGSSTPAVDIAYTSVDFAKPAAGDFNFTVPRGAKVTEGGQGAAHGSGGQQDGSAMTRIGSGWTAVAELKHAAGAKSGPAGASAGALAGALPGGAPGGAASGLPSLLGSVGHPVHGAFGSGTVVGTRLVNVLITSDGTVYAGAVTQSELLKAADSTAGK